MMEDFFFFAFQLALFSCCVSSPESAHQKSLTVSQLTLTLRAWEGIKGKTLSCFVRGGDQPEHQMTRLIWKLKTIFRSTAFPFFLLFQKHWLELSPSFSAESIPRGQGFSWREVPGLRQMQHTRWTMTSTGLQEGTPNALRSTSWHCLSLRGEWSAAFIDFQGCGCFNAKHFSPPFLCFAASNSSPSGFSSVTLIKLNNPQRENELYLVGQ